LTGNLTTLLNLGNLQQLPQQICLPQAEQQKWFVVAFFV
jgi:hypothetical protein